MLIANTAPYKEKIREFDVRLGISSAEGVHLGYYYPNETLSKVTIENSAPAGKFFGYAISKKMTAELLEKQLPAGAAGIRLASFIKGYEDTTLVNTLPLNIETIEYSETGKKITVTAYDIIHKAESILLKDIAPITFPITLEQYAEKIVVALAGNKNYFEADFEGVNPTITAANFDGSENLRTVLAAIAEATGTICYSTGGNYIKFRALDNAINDLLDPSCYFEFKTQDSVTLTQIVSATDLGDNYSSGEEGRSQVLWNNPFLTLRNDIPDLLNAIAARVVGLTFVPYSLKSRGIPAYEPGDRLGIVNIDGVTKPVYFTGETLTFNGGFVSTSEWVDAQEENPEANPTNISDVFKNTFARVNKISGEIQLVSSAQDELTKQMAEVLITTEGVTQTVSNLQTVTNQLGDELATVKDSVEASVSADEVSIIVNKEIQQNQIDSVTTSTGYVFDEVGLTISKSGSEMATQITEDGMAVLRGDREMLTADSSGVVATNLYASTYLFVGGHSRFENFTASSGKTRTGCYWLG